MTSSPRKTTSAASARAVIRPATPDDLEAITAIYNEAGVGTTASYDLAPVTVDQRREWMEHKVAKGFPVLVAEVDGQVAGFAAYGTFRELAGYDLTVEHSVYVDKGVRAAGLGRMLMRALIDRARGDGLHVMVGVLDADNQASIAFHEKLGFQTVGRMPQVGRKFDRWLDAVFVQLML